MTPSMWTPSCSGALCEFGHLVFNHSTNHAHHDNSDNNYISENSDSITSEDINGSFMIAAIMVSMII